MNAWARIRCSIPIDGAVHVVAQSETQRQTSVQHVTRLNEPRTSLIQSQSNVFLIGLGGTFRQPADTSESPIMQFVSGAENMISDNKYKQRY